MLIEASHTVTIRRPVAEVFAFLADPENDSAWRAGVLVIRHRSGEGVGAVYEQRVKGPAGRKIPADIHITALESPGLIAFETIAGPVRPSGRYILEDVGGATNVTLALSVSLGGIKRVLMGGAVRKTMAAEVRELDKLAALLETA
jgi:uncharacterized protein YndB with AHSA1/START domain